MAVVAAAMGKEVAEGPPSRSDMLCAAPAGRAGTGEVKSQGRRIHVARKNS